MAKVLTILDRITNLEAALNQVQQMSDSNVGQFRGALSNAVEVVAALIDVQGGKELDAKVQAKMDERRDARIAEQAKKAEDVLNTLLENGTLVVADVIGLDSVLTGREFDTEGNVTPPGYVQVQYAQLTDAAKAGLLGKGAGFVYENNGPKFEITGVYNFTSKAAVTPPLKEEALAPAEAPVEAAPATETPQEAPQTQTAE